MGEFSFTKADNLTRVGNIVYGQPFKMLIPKEFGGGFIQDRYQGYGLLATKETGGPKYDIHELLAFWNSEQPFSARCVRLASIHDETLSAQGAVREALRFNGDEFPAMKEIDEHTRFNRSIGIALFHDKDISLRYPLKLVSASYRGTYEDCPGQSGIDPNQGLRPLNRFKHWPF